MKSVRSFAGLFPITLALLAGATVASAQLSVQEVSGLSFTFQGAASEPTEDFLHVNSTIPGQQYTIDQTQVPWATVYDTSTGLVVVPNQTQVTAPGILGVRVNTNAAQTMRPGTYTGTIFLNAVPTVGTGVPVPMSLTILGPASGNLIVTPPSLTFNYVTGGPLPFPQSLSVASTGGSIAFSIRTSTTNGGAWLSAIASSASTPATATVAVYPSAAMGPGVYSGSVSVLPVSGAAQIIPVTLIISTIGTLTASPTNLTFNYQSTGPAPLPQTVTVVNAAGGAVSYSVTTSTFGAPNWLSASPVTGTTPSSFLVSVNPLGLGSGTYYGMVNIFQAGSSAPNTQIPVTLSVLSSSSSGQLNATPASLTFNYNSGGAAPSSQYISVTSTGLPLAFNATVSGLSWVRLSTSTGTTPAALSVSVFPPVGIAPGSYFAYILLSPVNGGTPTTVPVSVTVSAANYLSISQSSISFNSKTGSANPAPEVVSVVSSGPSIRFDAIASTAGSPPWLTATQSTQYTPGVVTVSVNPQGLAAGTYSGNIAIVADSANNSPQNIVVTLTVTSGITFGANPFGMSFSYQIGQPDPPFQIGVVSTQGGPATYALTTSTTSGGTWLLAAGPGVTPGTIIAAISPNLLSEGNYSGWINIQPTDPTLAPLSMPVVLNVAAGPVFMPGTNQLSFQYQLGGSVPQSQTVAVNASGGAAIVYYPTTQTSDGAPWLTASPNAGTSPSNVSVTVNPAGLAAGTYYGVVILTDAADVAPIAYVPVSLQVSSGPILTVAQQPLTFNASPGGTATAAQQITVGGSGTTNHYHVDTSASWLQVTPTDGITDAVLSVVANPANVAAGYYVGLITVSIPGVDNSQQYVPVVFVVR